MPDGERLRAIGKTGRYVTSRLLKAGMCTRDYLEQCTERLLHSSREYNGGCPIAKDWALFAKKAGVCTRDYLERV